MLLKTGKWNDGTGGEFRNNECIKIENGKIAAIGKMDDFSAEEQARLVDYSEYTLLPGLLDAHVHLFLEGISDLKVRTARWREEKELTLVRSVKNLEMTLQKGVTTVRDLGGPHGVSSVLKKSLSRKILQGPRVISSNRAISVTGGHFHYAGGREADGAEEMVKAVREQVKTGAEWIKIMVTGCVDFRSQDAGGVELSLLENQAVSAAARRSGRPVSAHANGCDGVKQALECGVTTLEHGALLDEATADAIAESPVFWVPTLVPFERMLDYSRAHQCATLPPAGIDEVLEQHRKMVFRAWQKGAKIVAGTDAGALGVEHGDLWREMVLLRESGFNAAAVIFAATGRAADAMGVAETVGRLLPGKRADFLIVNGDPERNMACMADVVQVYKDGAPIK
ncbi:MAG TPA: amidohydrolase family protein [Patescibacteria group bacterium]|nr:amidohydrolase family protein [Patescibacteria group bacterium]